MSKVHNFSGFMKERSKKVNEQFEGEENAEAGYNMGANPEDDAAALSDEENPDGENLDGEEEEPVTLESLKAMVDDITARVEKLEGGGEGDEEEEEGAEGEETPEA